MLSTGQLVYNAQSPDEAALVSAAKNFGFVFKVSHCYECVQFTVFFQIHIQVRTPFIIMLLNLHTGREVCVLHVHVHCTLHATVVQC